MSSRIRKKSLKIKGLKGDTITQEKERKNAQYSKGFLWYPMSKIGGLNVRI